MQGKDKRETENDVIELADAGGLSLQHVEGRGVQYVHWVMHKCIMVKVGGGTKFTESM